MTCKLILVLPIGILVCVAAIFSIDGPSPNPYLVEPGSYAGLQCCNSHECYVANDIEWMSLETHECIPRAGADKHPIPDKWVWRDDLLD